MAGTAVLYTEVTVTPDDVVGVNIVLGGKKFWLTTAAAETLQEGLSTYFAHLLSSEVAGL